jgi:ribosome-interacting GTPase 1
VLRGADAIIYCQEAAAPTNALRVVMREVAAAGIEKPAFLAATKADEAGDGALERLRLEFPDLDVVPVSIIDDESLEALKAAAWRLTGLIRVYLRRGIETDEEPLALPDGSTVIEAALAIHKDLAAGFKGARIWGPSARFPGQQVGREHVLTEGDAVEVLI